MDSTVIVSIISLIGSVIVTLFGFLSTTQLIKYRIDQLEKKVDKHNNIIERVTVLEHELNNTNTDISELFKLVRGITNEG